MYTHILCDAWKHSQTKLDSNYELFKRFALQVIHFNIRYHRVVLVICVCVVILSSYLNMIQICIKHRSLFDLCINILNKI